MEGQGPEDQATAARTGMMLSRSTMILVLVGSSWQRMVGSSMAAGLRWGSGLHQRPLVAAMAESAKLVRTLTSTVIGF